MTKRVTLQGITHGTSGYKRGCGCSICRKAKALERARERARLAARLAGALPEQRAQQPVTPTAALAAPAERVQGPVELELLAELDELTAGVTGVGAMAKAALALAREIDEAAGSSVAGATRQMLATLAEIRKLSKGSDDTLAAIFGDIRARPVAVPSAVRDSAQS